MPSTQTTDTSARPQPSPAGDGGASLDMKAIAHRYGWTESMARWWVSCAACSVGTKPEAIIAFLDRTVGGVAMIRR